MNLVKNQGYLYTNIIFLVLNYVYFYKLFAVTQDSPPNLCLKPLPKFILS